ncbi:MAG: hypothetical protein HGB08_02685 [Candidatus Moranbacteria bacterium]|nr:hypothetical protein [Candidatus Moranbacteria bacterium]
MTNIELKFVHISENAFFSQEGKLNIIGIFDRIFVVNFPAMQPAFAISIGLIGKKNFYNIKIEIVSPQNQVIASLGGNIEIKEDGGGANFVANVIGLPFASEGRYLIRIKSGEHLLSESNYLILEKANNV